MPPFRREMRSTLGEDSTCTIDVYGADMESTRACPCQWLPVTSPAARNAREP